MAAYRDQQTKQQFALFLIFVVLTLTVTIHIPNVDHWGHFGGLAFGALTTAGIVKQNGTQMRKMLRLIGITQVAFLGVLCVLVLFTFTFNDCDNVVYLGNDEEFHKLGDNCLGMCNY
mmetsp:Transcript_1570/g.3350  ORF Transcript_1570/g.3350 Transcript_1570/m.3350 type:complete len:117 (-) Transcript_1570:44-394(-)